MEYNKHMTKSTSWQPVAKWYNKLVGDKGQYYHQHVVIPGVLKLLSLDNNSRLLDIACGQGILGRSIPKEVAYTGIDVATALIHEAQKLDKNPKHVYRSGDVSKPQSFGDDKFTHAAIILAIQNIEDIETTLTNIAKSLQTGGMCVMVLNHPAFRIPRQSSWGIDEANKLQYRKINRYLSPLKIPITMNPGLSTSASTWSFHQPISHYVSCLVSHGFMIDALEEWASDKESQAGKTSKMENHARAEIPLFMAIRAKKL